MKPLQALWKGDMPLETAFWNYAVFGGILVNALTSAAFLILVVQEQVLAAVIAGYGVSLPYNFVVTVGVWRSAARETGRVSPTARLYPVITLIGMLILSLT